MPFRKNRRFIGTPAFASISNHLGVVPGRRDDLESLTYVLIYFLRGSLPWLTSEKHFNPSTLERKVDTSIEDLCRGIPSEIATILMYSRSLAFSEDPDYHYLRSLLHDIRARTPAPATCSLGFSPPDDPNITQLPPFHTDHLAADQPKAMPLRRSTRASVWVVQFHLPISVNSQAVTSLRPHNHDGSIIPITASKIPRQKGSLMPATASKIPRQKKK